MTRRPKVLLVRHAATAATRVPRFAGDEPLDAAGCVAAADMAGTLRGDRVVVAPSAACRQTAALAKLDPVEPVAGLADLDLGAWTNQELAVVGQADPGRLQAWWSDVTVAPPEGESVAQLGDRVMAVLERLATDAQRTVVITHAAVIRIAVLRALGAPDAGFWHLDVAPCSTTALHGRPDGTWTVSSCNVPAPTQRAVHA